MTTTGNPPRRRLLLPAAAGVLAAVAAGAVLYGTLTPAGKVAGACPAASKALAAKLAPFRGRAVLLNLWATWCVPCRAEMPALDKLQTDAGGKGFEVVAVNVDTARLERRAAFLDGIGVKSLARYADPSGDAFEALRKDGKALGLPVTLLIDGAGCEIGSAAGAVKWDSADAEALIGALKGAAGS